MVKKDGRTKTLNSPCGILYSLYFFSFLFRPYATTNLPNPNTTNTPTVFSNRHNIPNHFVSRLVTLLINVTLSSSGNGEAITMPANDHSRYIRTILGMRSWCRIAWIH